MFTEITTATRCRSFPFLDLFFVFPARHLLRVIFYADEFRKSGRAWASPAVMRITYSPESPVSMCGNGPSRFARWYLQKDAETPPFIDNRRLNLVVAPSGPAWLLHKQPHRKKKKNKPPI